MGIYEKPCNADQKSSARSVNKYLCYKIKYILNMPILHWLCLRCMYDSGEKMFCYNLNLTGKKF